MGAIVRLFRWLVTVLLALIFVGLFIPVLVVLRVNSTVLEPAFYIDQLRTADAYNFVYDEVIPSTLDGVIQDTGKLSIGDIPLDIELYKDEILQAVRDILPPEWLRKQTEQVIIKVVPYLTGQTDSFEVTVPIADRVEVAGNVLKNTLSSGDSFDSFYDGITGAVADQLIKNTDAFPFGMNLTREDIIAALETSVPKEWLLDQIDYLVDPVVSYLTGESQHFFVTIPLGNRTEPTRDAIKELIRKGNTDQFLFHQVVSPSVETSVGDMVKLPFGVDLEKKELMDALQLAATEGWINNQLPAVIDTGADYISGGRDNLELTVSLMALKVGIVDGLTELVDNKFETFTSSLAYCYIGQLPQTISSPGTTPICKPPGITYFQMKQLLGIDIAEATRLAVAQIPDHWTYTEGQMRLTLGDDAWDQVRELRQWMKVGITYTDEKMRKHLQGLDQKSQNADNQKQMDYILDTIRSGFVFNEIDLKIFVDEQIGLGQVDNMINNIQRTKNMLPLVVGFLIVLLIVIGFLGGRKWWSRLRVASAVFIIASAVALLSVVIGMSQLESLLIQQQDIIFGAIREEVNMPQVVVNKMTEIIANVNQDFFGGIRYQSTLCLVIGVGFFVGSIIGERGLRRLSQETSS